MKINEDELNEVDYVMIMRWNNVGSIYRSYQSNINININILLHKQNEMMN